MTRLSWSRLFRRTSPSLRQERRRGRFCKLGLETLEERIAPAQANWTGPATGGDWNTPVFWSTGNVPGPADTANIGPGNPVASSSGDPSRRAVLTGDGALNVIGGSLTVGNTAGSNFTVTTGGTVSGAGSVSVSNGAANAWSGGTMTGTGTTTFAAGSSLALSGTDTLAGARTLRGAGPRPPTRALNRV